MDTVNQSVPATPTEQPLVENESTDSWETALSLPHKAELWSGRVAMVGFVTTVMAIALKSTF
jgi:hypothetical protein